MEQIQLFEYHQKSVRTVMVSGQIWFVAKDVCEALDISWRGDTLDSIKAEWKGMRKFRTPGGEQTLTIISEPAIYKLAFRSNKPEAEKFTDWIAEEVIPQIRKTGRYQLPSVGILPIEMHAKVDVQKEMSKAVNGFNYHRGGKEAIVRYNVANCLVHSGHTPTKVKAIGKTAKLKSKDCQSAKAVLRKIKPATACCMSLADNLVEQGYAEEKVFQVTTKASEVFQGILDLGATPAELNNGK